MSLPSGTRLGPYEIVSPLGAGGMGEVYRARDTRLDRTVAVKILPAALAADPQLRERFEREARAISQLTHANICRLYDVGRSEVRGPEGLRHAPTDERPSPDATDVAQGFSPAEVDFLVLEYLEGESLERRLERGGLPLDSALTIAIEIADALTAAHRAGIVHRDLKPGNIMLTKSGALRQGSGQAKLLDFGLAKTTAPIVAGPGASMLLTTPPNVTAQGTILGTFQYMSPEQIEGIEADARSDIFAFGCVLYEMVTGKRAFEGKTRASVMGAILKDTPPAVSSVQSGAPASLDRVIAACLEKEPDDRLQSARDLALQLRWIRDGGAEVTGVHASDSPTRGRRVSIGSVIGVAAAAAVIAGAAAWALKPNSTPQPGKLTRFAVGLGRVGGDQSPLATGRHLMAISPDGTRIVYVANGQLYLRSMDQLEAVPLRGTNENPSEPFFSPDGQWVGYFARSKLKKISVTGGTAVSVCDAQTPNGASWDADRILFQEARGILEVSPDGGTPTVLVARDKSRNETLHGPHLLPGGETILFTAKPEGSVRWDDAQIVVQSLKTGQRKKLIEGGTDGRYLPTGHLVYVRDGVLLAAAFDAGRLELRGASVAMVEGIAETTANQTGAAQFAVSRAGSLVYLPSAFGQNRTLAWRDRQGRDTLINAPPRAYGAPRISPDGTRIAIDARDQENDIWIWDTARETLTRLTFGPSQEVIPLWTPDSRRIVYSSNATGQSGLFWKPADGTGQAEPLMLSPGQVVPSSFSRDGKLLAFYAVGDSRLMVLGLDGDRKPRPLTAPAPFVERNPDISPDGRWIAYESNESGSYEIYVRPFPAVEQGRWQISTDGGTRPRWAPNGRELFYLERRRLVSVSVQTGATFQFGKASPLFDLVNEAQPSPNRHYDVTPDGTRFVVIKDPQTATSLQLVVVEHWLEELKARVPGAK